MTVVGVIVVSAGGGSGEDLLCSPLVVSVAEKKSESVSVRLSERVTD